MKKLVNGTGVIPVIILVAFDKQQSFAYIFRFFSLVTWALTAKIRLFHESILDFIGFDNRALFSEYSQLFFLFYVERCTECFSVDQNVIRTRRYLWIVKIMYSNVRLPWDEIFRTFATNQTALLVSKASGPLIFYFHQGLIIKL